MTDNEIELISLIRNADHPEDAMIIAIKIILQYLEQPESFEAPSSVCPLELA